MATTSSSDFYLAKELIFEMLSWLPVRSLLRFKSVCKSWFSIISSPAFIETHLNNTNKKQPSSLIWLFSSLNEYPSHFQDAVGIDTIVDEHVRINIPRNFIGMNLFFCSCNGLLYHLEKENLLDPEVLFIWNPLTKWLKKLPASEKKTELLRGNDNIGFGFDFISNDYKILRITNRSKRSSSVLIEVDLYSVYSDSWKEIQVPCALTSSVPRLYSRVVHANGVLYWVADDSKKLLAFDLHTEVFGEFSLPNPLQHTEKSHVLDYEGSVAMVFEELDGDGSVLSLWTLDGVSWTKKFNLEVDHSKINWVHLYLGVGQFVAGDYNHRYVIYDHRKKQTKKFPLPFYADKVSLDMFSESLVSVEGFEQQE